MKSNTSNIQEPQSQITYSKSTMSRLTEIFSGHVRMSKKSKHTYYDHRKRTIKVIESCRTMEQLETANRYAELAGLKGDGVTDAFIITMEESLKGI